MILLYGNLGLVGLSGMMDVMLDLTPCGLDSHGMVATLHGPDGVTETLTIKSMPLDAGGSGRLHHQLTMQFKVNAL